MVCRRHWALKPHLAGRDPGHVVDNGAFAVNLTRLWATRSEAMVQRSGSAVTIRTRAPPPSPGGEHAWGTRRDSAVQVEAQDVEDVFHPKHRLSVPAVQPVVVEGMAVTAVMRIPCASHALTPTSRSPTSIKGTPQHDAFTVPSAYDRHHRSLAIP